MTTTKDEKVEEPTVPQEEIIEETVSEASTEEPELEVREESTTPEKEEKLVEEKLTEDERKNLSEKAQKRFGDLSKKAAKVPALENEVRTLREAQDGEFTAGLEPDPRAVSPSSVPPRLPWEQSLAEGEQPTISPDDYKRDVMANADFIVEQRIKQSDSRRDKVVEVKTDLVALQEKHDRLNPKSEGFDKDLSTKLAGLYQNQLKADPNARLLDFVDTVMDVRASGKEEGKTEAVSQINEQEAEEALTPSETGGEETPIKFEELSVGEQEKYLKNHGLWE